MATPNELIKEAYKMIGQPYCWGGNGETVGSLIRNHATSHGQDKKSTEEMLAFINKMIKADLDTVHLQDCSGLMVYLLRKINAYQHDLTAEEFYKKCTKVDEPFAGCFAFYYNGTKHNHIGLCVDNKNVIHDLSTKVGVVLEPLDKRQDARGKSKWVDFGRPDFCIDFSLDTVTLNKEVYVYMTAHDAEVNDTTKAVTTYKPNLYYIFRTYGCSTNITRTKGSAGGWVRNDILFDAEQ